MKRAHSLFEGCVEEDEGCKKPKVNYEWKFPTPEHHWGIDFGKQECQEVPEGQTDALPSGESISATDYYNTYVARSPEQCVREGCAPQRSVEWKNARRFAITASDFGAALGTNAYCSSDELVKKKIWDSFKGNAATHWGATQEARAEEAFLLWARKTISTDAQLHALNLTKFSEIPWIAVSPDGILTYTLDGVLHADLVEYKCPTRTQTDTHPYAQHPKNTPPYYRDQMMGMAHYMNACGGISLTHGGITSKMTLESAWFVVWQPQTLWVVKHELDESEWNRRIFPGLRAFYFSQFLPALVWYHNGILKTGESKPDEVALEL